MTYFRHVPYRRVRKFIASAISGFEPYRSVMSCAKCGLPVSRASVPFTSTKGGRTLCKTPDAGDLGVMRLAPGHLEHHSGSSQLRIGLDSCVSLAQFPLFNRHDRSWYYDLQCS